MKNEYFDNKAKTWDDNPNRLQLAHAITDYLQEVINFQSNFTVLDFGCGTGLLSFLLSDKVKSIHAVDTSEGMLEQIKKKVSETNVTNITVANLDISNSHALDTKYDVIVSSMAMHHLEDMPGVVQKLADCVKPGGWIALADLCKEDGSFHTEIKVPHFGFEPITVKNMLKHLSFSNFHIDTVFHICRNERTYPIFCVCAKKQDHKKGCL